MRVSLGKTNKVKATLLVLISVILASTVALITLIVLKKDEGASTNPIVYTNSNYKVINTSSALVNGKKQALEDSLFEKQYLARIDVSYNLVFPNKKTQYVGYPTVRMLKDNGYQGTYQSKMKIPNLARTYTLLVTIKANSKKKNSFTFKFEAKGLPLDYKILKEDIKFSANESYFYDLTSSDWIDITDRTVKVNEKEWGGDDTQKEINITPETFKNDGTYETFADYHLNFTVYEPTQQVRRESPTYLRLFILPQYPKNDKGEVNKNEDPTEVKYFTWKDGNSKVYSYDEFKEFGFIEFRNRVYNSPLDGKKYGSFIGKWGIRLRLTFSDATKDDTKKNFFAKGMIIQKIEYIRLDAMATSISSLEISLSKTT